MVMNDLFSPDHLYQFINQVSFYGVILEHLQQVTQPDELWLLIGDEGRDTTVKIVALAGFDRAPLLESIGKTVMFKHVYVLTATSVFYDDMVVSHPAMC